MSGQFDTLWFSALLLGGGGYAAAQGLKVAIRRRVENPLFPLEGGRALGLGLGMLAIGLLAVAFAVREILAARGGGG